MNYDIAEPGLADAGARRIAWAGRRMPVLATVRERFEKEKPLKGHVVAACLHVTAETANLMLALRDGGAEPILCASNPLSTQDDVAAALVAQGISVFAIRGIDNDGYYKHINAALDHAPAITMDDGADLATLLHTERRDLEVIGSTEETTTGVIRLRAMAADGTLRVPVVAVNDSATKHLFDNRYGTGQSVMDGLLRASNVLIAGLNVVVVGYGDCGQGVASRADGLGAHVIVVEVDPVRALSAAMDGFRVMTAMDAAREGDIFVTVTGNKHVLRSEHFEVMKDGAMLANAGHFDIELDLASLRLMAVEKRNVRDHLDEFEMADGRRILVAAEGRLV
ncbi:MAG: adenosylhomocysteinase, partial [Acidimicrobiia bacterium]|nr:adenosylhomocysteinase [Acidimicrobiia bacterium]